MSQTAKQVQAGTLAAPLSLAGGTCEIMPIRPIPVDSYEVAIPPGVTALRIERYPDGSAARVLPDPETETLRVSLNGRTPVLLRFITPGHGPATPV